MSFLALAIVLGVLSIHVKRKTSQKPKIDVSGPTGCGIRGSSVGMQAYKTLYM